MILKNRKIYMSVPCLRKYRYRIGVNIYSKNLSLCFIENGQLYSADVRLALINQVGGYDN